MVGTADVALFGGSVYTADREYPWAEAVAIEGGRIVGVGSEQSVRELCGPGTQAVNLAGRLVLPGFQDSHVHPPMGGVEMLRCDLTKGRSRSDYLDIVGRYARAHPDAEWIQG